MLLYRHLLVGIELRTPRVEPHDDVSRPGKAVFRRVPPAECLLLLCQGKYVLIPLIREPELLTLQF